MKILISGTSGFIGGNLQCLLADHFEITSIGRDSASEVGADFGKLESIESINIKGYDLFIYCSGVTDEEFANDTLKGYQRSTHYFSKLIYTLIKQGVKHFIYFSTGRVYGSFEGFINEDSIPTPIDDYSIGHYAAEQILRKFSHEFDIRVLVIRPGAVFGLPANWDTFKRWHLIQYSFPLNCVYQKKIVLRSSGSQKRNFVNVIDIANYILVYFKYLKVLDRYLIINPVGESNLSIYEFALKCSEIYTDITGKDCEIIRSNETQKINNYFAYQTKYKVFKQSFRNSIDDYLRLFIEKAIVDYSNNIIYKKMK